MDSSDFAIGLAVSFAALIGLGLIFIVVVQFTGLPINTGNGQHIGFVTSTETNGLIFKTNRAYVKTDTMSSQEDQYCVEDPAVFSQLGQYADQKAHVELKYKSVFSAGITNCDGEDAIITSVILAPIAQ